MYLKIRCELILPLGDEVQAMFYDYAAIEDILPAMCPKCH